MSEKQLMGRKPFIRGLRNEYRSRFDEKSYLGDDYQTKKDIRRAAIKKAEAQRGNRGFKNRNEKQRYKKKIVKMTDRGVRKQTKSAQKSYNKEFDKNKASRVYDSYVKENSPTPGS